MKDKYYFPAVFGYAPGEEISVVFPDLGVASSGTDDADALSSAKELLGVTIFGLEEDGEPIPEPSRLNEIALDSNERAVLVEVFMPSIRMANVNRSVTRTVTLPAWLNALALENNINFSQTLQDALREKLRITPLHSAASGR
jgi:predicted RNase H-like HicB family nuclease